MNAPERQLDWADLNQRLLVAEFERLKQRLGADGDEQALVEAVDAARAAMPAPPAIDELTECFGLSRFERELLLLCAGAEMDAQIAIRCSLASAEFHRQGVSFAIAQTALDGPHWSAITPVAPLRGWRLIEVDDAASLARGALRIDERILHYLAGINHLDARLQGLLRLAAPPAQMAEPHAVVADAVGDLIEDAPAGDEPVVWLSGDDSSGQADVAAHVAATVGLALHFMQARDVPGAPADARALATLWQRDAMLLGSALLVCTGGDALSDAALRFIESLHGLVFVSGQVPQPLGRPSRRFNVNKPEPAEQKRLWQQSLGDAAFRMDEALDGVAGQFRLSARAIQAEAALLAPQIRCGDPPGQVIWTACRSLGRGRLEGLAQRIEAAADWHDLVLPQAQLDMLRQIGGYLRHRLKVYVEWGFSDRSARGLGISALFAGESGTGKTMAAEVLARELQIDLYRIDLSAVVSKYIGETEKNLRSVFDAAEDSGAILLFDEADALFGRRSEVKDSHDRYANIEVSYLLQRMEAYRGLVILTTNLKDALDPAFQRRLRFIVHFPFPDQALREAIWRGVFPERTPRAGIDCAKLARLGVTGAGIRNIAIDAAFRAAAVDEPLTMQHLLQAARFDAAKRGRSLSDAETRGWE